MNFYEVPMGTQAKLLERNDRDMIEMQDWLVRKDLSFSETVLDPISLHNSRQSNIPEPLRSVAVGLAERGYAIFGGEFGSDHSQKYLLAVKYQEVAVS